MTKDERHARAEERRVALEAQRRSRRLARELRFRVEAILLERRLEAARARGEVMAGRRTRKEQLIYDRVVRWGREHPDARRAHRLVHRALRAGKLEKPDSCDGCGLERRLEAHHEDYSRPLWVRWLCRACHLRRHRPEIAPRRPTVPEKSGNNTLGAPERKSASCLN